MSSSGTSKLVKWARVGGLSLLSGVFLLAGISKAADPTQFLFSLEGYRILPEQAAYLLALYLPWLEIVLALGVWVRWSRPGALLGLIGLLVAFSLAIASVWARGIDIDCGCFSNIIPDTGYALSILRNLGFIGIAGGLLIGEGGRIRGR